MRFFIRTFIFLIVIAALGYGYIWYKNKSMVDEAFAQMNMMTSARYDSTHVSLDGKSVTSGIKILIPDTNTEMSIEEFQIGTDSLLNSVKLGRAFSSKQFDKLPTDYMVKLKGLKMPISLEMESALSAENPDFFTELTFAGCGDKKQLDITDYGDLGYNQINVDATTNITLDNSAGQAVWDMYLSAKDFGSLKMKFVVDNVNFAIPNPKLRSMSIETADDGYIKKVNTLCSGIMNLSAAQYSERHISYLKHKLYKQGIYLSKEFYDLYTTYHADPRSIKVTSYPDKSIEAMAFMNMSVNRIMSSLNLAVSLNDVEVGQLIGARPLPSELPELDSVTPEEETITTIQGLTLQDTPVADLNKYVGYQVYFDYRGKEYKGIVKSVGSRSARIAVYFDAVNFYEQPFRTSEISNLQVRREWVPVKTVAPEVVEVIEETQEAEVIDGKGEI